MPERDWRLPIEDISVAIENIEKIERYTANLTLTDFQADERTLFSANSRSSAKPPLTS
jgi:uncharacterized protein with HEPN domain